MTADSQLAVQTALVAALQADSSVAGLLAQGAASVLDHVPQSTPYPYLVVGESKATPFDSKTEEGMEQVVTLHSWSTYNGMSEIKSIMAAVVAALDRASLAVSGHALVDISFVSSEAMLDEDGVTRHGIQRFRVLTEAA